MVQKSKFQQQGVHMRSQIVFSIASILFLMWGLIPAMGGSLADHVVINEIDTNPPGDDSKSISEWVELYNPTSSEVNIGGWKIASTTILKKTLTIPEGTTIKPGQFLTFSYTNIWFTDVSEVVQLKDKNQVIIDETPALTDVKNDFTSWQRIYDGFDFDSDTDWKFVFSNAGSSNGKLKEVEEKSATTVIVSTDKSQYAFGETAIISGSVSEQIFIEKPFFQAAKIVIKISGPEFFRTIELYPDLNLKFKTSLNLQKILGINEGLYIISVDYAGSSVSSEFLVGEKIVEIPQLEGKQLLVINTDKISYIPGQLVTITATTDEHVPFEALRYVVLDPNGDQIYDGSLFPIIKDSKAHFSTKIFLDTVSPIYGTYQIIGEYSAQKYTATFTLSEDIKEDVPISLRTDKEVYRLGETVTISGRTNKVWIDSLDLEVLQTGDTALGTKGLEGGDFIFKKLDVVRLAGDSTFLYEFKIPTGPEFLGDYRIKVSKEIGTAITFFSVSENPEEFVKSTEPFTLYTDNQIYSLGDPIRIFGKIKEIQESSSFQTPLVDISIKGVDGSEILSSTFKPTGGKPPLTTYSLTAIPDIVGNYKVDDLLKRGIFEAGIYDLKATYAGGKYSASTSITIVDPLDLGGERLVLTLDKEVYGLGETVNLNGITSITTQVPSLTLTLVKPDGKTLTSGLLVENGKFNWSWTTPSAEKVTTIKSADTRSLIGTNLGIYKIKVGADSGSTDIFFKVSLNPETDSLLSVEPLIVSTEKSLYKPGEKLKVIGTVLKRPQGSEGLVVPDRVQIKILTKQFPQKEILEAFALPDQGGQFSSIFDLPIGVFQTGEYEIVATYLSLRDKTTFGVASDLLISSDEKLQLIIETDKKEYHPGDIVTISGRPNKIVYLETFDVSIIKKSESAITCGTFFCGKHQGSVKSIRPNPSSSFVYEFKIPSSLDSIGTYEVIVDVRFDTSSLTFDVVEEIPSEIKKKAGDKIIEKFNRIPDVVIPISVDEKTIEDYNVYPRVIQGSLITTARGEESSVNLKVSTASGLCVIGQDSDCLVRESTRTQGGIYKIIEIEGINYNVRYSGHDVRLEKFTILPQSEDSIRNNDWLVEIIKGDQPSRFYYKVSNIVTE